MSVSGKVGKWEFVWKSVPRGPAGTAQVEVREAGSPPKSAVRVMDVRWRRDADGLWLELPDGVHGFDVQGEAGDDGRPVYQVSERGGERFWQCLSYLRSGEEQAAAGAAGAKKHVRVRAQMPGKILRINVKAGATVEKGQSILVMEAMKMENEIRASQTGVVGQIKVTEGQAVETGADLCLIEPSG
jgi:acetyl/propionyl-CoA carboxylase alpha subunit